MAMLAEPRRKQKWTLNPRGKQWSEDSNKFGQKMLEKMGWSSGKGLGVQEQGMVEHVRVKMKNDQCGIGFNKDNDKQWTEHQDDFNSFLQSLQKDQVTDSTDITEDSNKILSGKSLEEMSKQSQKRVHYKKFTRGKDVNKYSKKDLANIFGKKEMEEISKEEEMQIDTIQYDPIGAKDTTSGILTIKGGNIDNYFKNKMEKYENNYSNQKQKTSNQVEDSNGLDITRKTKSQFYVDNNTDLNNDSDASQKYQGFGFPRINEIQTKNKKLNNLNYVFDNPCLDLNILNDFPISKNIVADNIETNDINKCSKKRKNNFIYDNEGLDLEFSKKCTPKKRKNESTCKEENLIIEKDENSKQIIKNKKIKNEVLVVGSNDNSSNSSESLDKSKLKLRIIKDEVLPIDSCEDYIMNLRSVDNRTVKNIEIFRNTNPGLSLELSNKEPIKKMKKQAKIKNLTAVYENAGLDLDLSSNSESLEIKHIKEEPFMTGYENPGLDLNFPDRPTPKKKKQEIKLENLSPKNSDLVLEFSTSREHSEIKNIQEVPFLPGYDNPGLDLDVSDRPTLKKIEKEMTTEHLSAAYENPGLDLEYISSYNPEEFKNTTMELEVPNRPTLKKIKKPKKSSDLCTTYDNPALDLDFPDVCTAQKSKKNKYERRSKYNVQSFDESTPKKIKKKDNSIDLPILHENSTLNLENEDTNIFQPIETMKNKSMSVEYDNAGLDLEYPIKTISKNTKKEKKSKQMLVAYENSGLDLECSYKTEGSKNKKNEFSSEQFTISESNLEVCHKSGKKKSKIEREANSLSGLYEAASNDVDSPKNKIHNPSEFEVFRTVSGVENIALDLSDEQLNKKHVTFNNQIEYNTDIGKKRKKKRKLNKYEVENSKLKHKNIILESFTFDNEALNVPVVNEEEIDNELNERRSKKCKRRKELRIPTLETIEEVPEDNISNKSEIMSNENIQTMEMTSDISDQKVKNIDILKTKRNKKKKNNLEESSKHMETESTIKTDIEKSIIGGIVTAVEVDEVIDKIKQKKKKKKTKKSNESNNTEKENLFITENHVKFDNCQIEKNQEVIDDVVSLEEFLQEDNENLNLKFKNRNKKKNSHVDTANSNKEEENLKVGDNKQHYFDKMKKSKQVMKSLFIKNPTLLFNGSNINEIQGYGSHLTNNYY